MDCKQHGFEMSIFHFPVATVKHVYTGQTTVTLSPIRGQSHVHVVTLARGQSHSGSAGRGLMSSRSLINDCRYTVTSTITDYARVSTSNTETLDDQEAKVSACSKVQADMHVLTCSCLQTKLYPAYHTKYVPRSSQSGWDVLAVNHVRFCNPLLVPGCSCKPKRATFPQNHVLSGHLAEVVFYQVLML
jgi:hypothetical protein